jgi:hypothetical protein
MSTEFSDSEVFVLGALSAACEDHETWFHANAAELFGMLGLWHEPDTVPKGEIPVESVPEDIVWGTAQPPGQSSLLSPEQLAVLRNDLQHVTVEALTFLEERAGGASNAIRQLHDAVAAYSETVLVACGYAFSTPDRVYVLKRNGRFYQSEPVTPLPSGLVKLVLSRVCTNSTVPLGWFMAMPDVFRSLSPEVTISVVPSIETGECIVGEDNPDERSTSLLSLAGKDVESPAFTLGAGLWKLRCSCDHFLREENGGDQGEITPADDENSSAPEVSGELFGWSPSDAVPSLIAEVLFLAKHSEKQRASCPDDLATFQQERISTVTHMLGEAQRVCSLAHQSNMPQVASLLDEVAERLRNHLESISNRTFFSGSDADYSMFWAATSGKLGNAICLGYGDLLLRERHVPAPIPTAKAKAGLFSQPDRVRFYLQNAVGHLKRDAAHPDNCAFAVSVLGLVLEPLIKQAAEIYLRYTPSTKVADLLHTLMQEAKERTSPEKEELEIIARFGMALHHGLRNHAVHNIADLAGDWESAQFFVFGLLSILNVLERARSRAETP